MQTWSKINASTLGKYKLGQFNYIFVSRKNLYNAVIILTNFVNLTAN